MYLFSDPISFISLACACTSQYEHFLRPWSLDRIRKGHDARRPRKCAEFLSIPAMAIEYGWALSSAKKLIIPERNALADATIETTECLRGLVELCPNQTRLGGGAQRRRGLQQHLDTIGQSPSTRWYIYVVYLLPYSGIANPQAHQTGPRHPSACVIRPVGSTAGMWKDEIKSRAM